jgi:hypothetical protein
MDTETLGFRGDFLDKDETLPILNPSANLAGIWKGLGARLKDCCHASQSFFISAVFSRGR